MESNKDYQETRNGTQDGYINRYLHESVHNPTDDYMFLDETYNLIGGFILNTKDTGLIVAGTPVAIDIKKRYVYTDINDTNRKLPIGILPFPICVGSANLTGTLVCIRGTVMACKLPPISEDVAYKLNFAPMVINNPENGKNTHYYTFDSMIVAGLDFD